MIPGERVSILAQKIRFYQKRYEYARDDRAIFAFVYGKVSEDLASRLERRNNSFDSPEWIATLAEVFAARFFSAMDAIDDWLERTSTEGRLSSDLLYASVPKPWADAYLAIRGHSYVLEDLVFSMMAHLSHDLPLAVLDARLETGGASHVGDYHRMNEILADQAGALEISVGKRYNPLLRWLDRITGHYDVFFTGYGIRIARSLAWYNAYRLRDPLSKDATYESIARSTGEFIKAVRHPKEWWLKGALRIARFVVPRYRRWPRPSEGNRNPMGHPK